MTPEKAWRLLAQLRRVALRAASLCEWDARLLLPLPTRDRQTDMHGRGAPGDGVEPRLNCNQTDSQAHQVKFDVGRDDVRSPSDSCQPRMVCVHCKEGTGPLPQAAMWHSLEGRTGVGGHAVLSPPQAGARDARHGHFSRP